MVDLRGGRWSGRGCSTVRWNCDGRLRPGVRWAVVGLALLVATLAVTAAGAGAAASPSPNATVVPVDGTVPRDVNDDGRYMDLNENGEVDFDDVVTYFGHMDGPAMTDHAAAYDYNGNGEVDFADLVTLFQWTDRPAARFEVDASAPSVGTPVSFDAAGSSGVGPDGSYQWSFGDGTTASGATATHAYAEPGSYEVTLRVADADGVTNTARRTITVRSDGDRRPDAESDERVTAYYTSWARYERNYTPADVPLDDVTHVNYAFLDVEPNGTVVMGDRWADRQNLEAFRERSTNHPNTTFLLSVGGWSYSEHFSDAALTEERRERFARTAVALMRQYDFDGVDVDWEYPGGGGQSGNVVRERDPRNFTLLVEEVRDRLDRAERRDGREYELTVAVSADPEKAQRLEVDEIDDDVDAINVMTYDYHGSWERRTNHNAPLYASPDDPTARGNVSVNRTMQFWASQPIDREKVSVGLPFYGRGYAGVPSTNDGLYQSFTGTPQGTYGSQGVYEYWDVNQNLNASESSFRYRWDDQAKVPYLYSADREVFVSFDDRRSIRRKVAYARDNDWGGVVIWALSHDRNGTLLTAVNDELAGSTNETTDGDVARPDG